MQKLIPNDFPDFCISESEESEKSEETSIKQSNNQPKNECKKRILELKNINSDYLKESINIEEENVEFRLRSTSVIALKGFLDICRKINTEIELVIFEKGITCVISNISGKHLIQTAFKREHFLYYHLKPEVLSINIDSNDLFSFIKKINKGEILELIKLENNDEIIVNILNFDDILYLTPNIPLTNYLGNLIPNYNNILYFDTSGPLINRKSSKIKSYKFTSETQNAKIGIVDAYENEGIKINSLLFNKYILFMVKNKVGKILFRIFTSGKLELEGLSQKIVIMPEQNQRSIIPDVKLTEAILPLNILLLILKFISINSYNGILTIIPINQKCFSIESIIMENVISRFCLKGKLNK